MSSQMVRVMHLADHEHGSLGQLTDEILKDVALTNKLLRVVNAARFAGHQDGVGTVSRAVSLLGVTTLRQLALGLVLLEHLEDRQQARWLRECYMRTLLAAQNAVELSAGQVKAETAFLATLFQFLGPMVVLCHFPEVSQGLDIRGGLDAAALNAQTLKVLGVSLDEMGQMVATMWSLPEDVRRVMQRPEGAAPARVPHDSVEQMRWVARAATELAQVQLDGAAALQGAAQSRMLKAYLPLLQLSDQQARERLEQARQHWSSSVRALGLAAEAQQRWAGVLDSAEPSGTGTQACVEDGLVGTVQPVALSAEDVLTQGLDDLTAAMVEGVVPVERARMALEVLCRALGLARAVVCKSMAAGGPLRGWVVLGAADTLRNRLQIARQGGDDVLSKLVATGRDTWVPDVMRAPWVSRLPAWFPPPQSGAILLLPLYRGQELLGVVYADGGGSGQPVEMPAKALLQSWRRLLLMCLV